MFDYDAEIRRYNEPFRVATGVGPGDQVLDVGCGAGQSTRDAARAAAEGSALGVDLNVEMLEVARRRSVDEGVGNVRFEVADAQRHPFPGNHFDVVISRFGTMFFADSVAAFSNLGRALRPGGRLVMLVWQAGDRQEWAVAIREALGSGPGANEGPFSLADPETGQGILDAAGFVSVEHKELREPIYYGSDAGSAYEAVLNLRMAKDPQAGLTSGDRQPALDRLRETLAAHETGDGVWFDSSVWVISATRP
jgi:SAM-dependent methyltransferase